MLHTELLSGLCERSRTSRAILTPPTSDLASNWTILWACNRSAERQSAKFFRIVHLVWQDLIYGDSPNHSCAATGFQLAPSVAVAGRPVPWDCLAARCIYMLLDWIVPTAAAQASMTTIEPSACRVPPPCLQRLAPPRCAPWRERRAPPVDKFLRQPGAHLNHIEATVSSHNGILASRHKTSACRATRLAYTARSSSGCVPQPARSAFALSGSLAVRAASNIESPRTKAMLGTLLRARPALGSGSARYVGMVSKSPTIIRTTIKLPYHA